MRRSMASTLWRFSTTRMLHDYLEKMYLPAAEAGAEGAMASSTATAEAETTSARVEQRSQRTAATG